ncbi:MAG: hypothetical protein ACKVU0_06180 [Saprospiraceae bacterium]
MENNNLQKFVKSWGAYSITVAGLLGLAIDVTLCFIHHFDDNHEGEDIGIYLIIGLLSIILSVIGYERIELREQVIDKIGAVEKKYDSLFKIANKNSVVLLEQIQNLKHRSEYELIVGTDDITTKARTAIELATKQIRATSFHSSGAIDLKDSYFEALAHKIHTTGIHYFCAYDENHDLKNRIEIFDKYNFNDTHYNRIESYKIPNEKTELESFNFLIIDDTVAFIAFPQFGHDKEINIMFKFDKKSKSANKDLIGYLSDYYDATFKLEIYKVSTKDELSIKS